MNVAEFASQTKYPFTFRQICSWFVSALQIRRGNRGNLGITRLSSEHMLTNTPGHSHQ